MRVMRDELAVMARLVARESRANPSPNVDAALALILETARRRGHEPILAEVRAILETETGPVGPVRSAEVSPEG